MRSFLVILVAIFAVSCSKSEVRSNEQKADSAVSGAAEDVKDAAVKTGAELKEAAAKAKPDIDRIGDAAQAGLKDAAKDIKSSVHEATADSSETPASSQ
jgi:hypothetical protein